ncbi:hypothetical protein MM35RIKEN_09120 [Vescimonas fastidiosa]|uniref:Uncharacterized protein n=1 Tax=Vescimonas fastidiosa TaxID=2714353 RepID=A0A810PS39_9FIRM|nr:hypothetical protein MM35RIKEN_09120 [Vescimonas fastidiosa]
MLDEKMTKPLIVVDKKKDMDIIRDERISSGRLYTDVLPFLLTSD